MSGIKITRVKKTGEMKVALDKKVESPSDFLKAIAGLKSKLFHLRKENQKLQSDLTSTNDQRDKLLQKVEEAEAFKQQAETENTKLRHREVELESLLAAERAHSRELEKTNLLEERPALLEELKTAWISAGDHQQTTAAPNIEDKVVEARESQPRRKKNTLTILLTLEEDPEKDKRRCQELEASLLQAAECSRQALQDKEQEHIAELELLDEEMQAAATNAERLIAIRANEWQQEKNSFLLLAEINRQSLKDEEQDSFAKLRRQREEKEELEHQFEVKAIEWREEKALLFLVNNLCEKALAEKQLELKTVTDQMSRLQNRKWYQRLLPRCLRAQD